MNFPGRLIAGFMVVILIFIFPLQYIAESHSENIDSLVDNRTKKLSDDIREKGYIDKPMYESYVDYLDTTGEMYDLELQDINPVKGEELASSSSEKKSLSNNLMLSSANKSINTSLLSTNEIQSFATHTHTDDCYAGDLHVCDGASCKYEGKTIILGIAIEDGHYSKLYYSEDGISWKKSLDVSSSYASIRSLTYGKGKFIAADDWSNKVYISENGLDWDVISVMTGYYNQFTPRFLDLTYTDGNFYAVASYREYSDEYADGGLYLLKSEDGISWTEVKKLASAGYSYSLSGFGVTKNGSNTYLMICIYPGGGLGSEIYLYNVNSGTYSSLGASVNTINGYQQAGDVLYYVKNGTEFWKQGNIIYGDTNHHYIEEFDKLQYGKNSYLAIKKGTGIFVNNPGTWKFNQISHDLNIPNVVSLIYCGDKYLMSGITDSGDYRIYTSQDGSSWNTYTPIDDNGKYFNKTLAIVCNAERGSGEIDRGPCLKIGKYYDNNGNEIVPICNQVVTSITATKTSQTVRKGQPIITTATATYLDGHTGIVNCTSNYNPNHIGVQTVTLTYRGLVGNAKTTGTRTCTIGVTVQPDKNLTSLTVTPTSQNIVKYSMPSFSVKANYSDGTNKLISTSQYSLTGFDMSKIGLQSVTISYTESGITKSSTVYITVGPISKECPRCHRYYELNPDDTDPGCPHCIDIVIGIDVLPDNVEVIKGHSLPIIVIAEYMDETKSEVSGWVSNYNPTRLGLQIVTVEYGGYAKDITVWVNDEYTTCPICNTDYPKSEGACPVCSEKAMSISVSPKEITIMQYETIALTVTAFYADGSSREVDEWSIDTATGKPGTYNATVSYKGVKDTVKLNIISINSIECPICHTIYDVIESPSGCPICSKEIIGIEAYLTSGGNLVQYGSNPNIVIILVFRDDHREFGNGEYTIDNYNPQELGIQTITVIYKDFTTTMVIEVVNMVNEIICPNGHIYHSNTDGSDPGCPYCHTGEEVSKIAYFDITYTTEIIDTVYLEGAYYFTKGNYVSIIVIKKDKSLLYKMQDTFFSTSILGRKRRYIHGGEVY